MSNRNLDPVRRVLADPATSYWLSDALTAALDRDPVDAVEDAETLVSLLRGIYSGAIPADDSSEAARRRELAEALAAALKNVAKLPPRCYDVLPSDAAQLILIIRGEPGYSPVHIGNPLGSPEDMAQTLNNALGVTGAQREAMLTGSLFGWEVPGADPDRYSWDGKRKAGSDQWTLHPAGNEVAR